MQAGHVAAMHRKAGKKSGGSPRTPRAESGKKRAGSARGQGSLGWVPVAGGADSWWVVGRKGEASEEIGTPETAVVSGSLFAHVVPAATLDIGDHMPLRPDSMFIHPETMRLCGFGIAQPVVVRSVDHQRPAVVICKPWPCHKIDLDTVACSSLALQSFASESEGGRRREGEGRERVEVWKVPSPTLLPPASEIHLSPLSAIDVSLLNESFKNYMRSVYDGFYVCQGNTVSVQFCNEDIHFTVEKVIPVSQIPEPNTGMRLSFNSSQSLATLLEDGLQLDMSGLSLGGGGRGGERGERKSRSRHASPSSPARTAQSGHPETVTSTPRMDVDETPVHSGMESRRHLDVPRLECEGEDADCAISLEWQMAGLGLGDGTRSEAAAGEREEPSEASRGEGLVEVTVCKITSKTRVVFVESNETDGDKAHMVMMADIGGLATQKQLLRELVVYPLQNPSMRGIQFPRGVVLHGVSGVGKTLLALAVSSETSAHCLSLSPGDLISSDCDKRLREMFTEAREKSPVLVLLDDLHVLCGSGEGSGGEGGRRGATMTLAACLDALHTAPPSRHVVVVATTNQIEAVDTALRRPGRFDREIEVTVPNAAERREVLEVLLRGVANCLGEDEVVGVADCAHGYTGADLRAVVMQAQHRALRRHLGGSGGVGDGDGVAVRGEDVRGALREVRPSAMREVTVEVPKVLWADIGGQADVKQRLREAVEWPLKHPEVFSRLGIAPPKGVLLYGPPGCSKTMIAQALATESGLNFISVKGPELFSKWVGDSEKAVRQVFRRARAAAPAIIFFDEIDALAVQRKSEGSSVADRVLAQLLTEMDGVEALKDVLIVAATNRPDMIDKSVSGHCEQEFLSEMRLLEAGPSWEVKQHQWALLRPGRIDRMIYVPLPSNDTRKEIFQIRFRSTPVASDVSLEQLVTRTQGFSGAEVVALCQEAALCAMHEDIATVEVASRHFEQALLTITPQTQPSTLASYEHYRKTI